MPEARTYTGGCHCGKVRYEVTTELSQVIACNCSICTKRGLLLTFVGPDRFDLLAGADSLADYQFGKKNIHHLHCSACGIESFARGIAPNGQESIAVNVRCLENVDIDALDPTPFDGRSL